MYLASVLVVGLKYYSNTRWKQVRIQRERALLNDQLNLLQMYDSNMGCPRYFRSGAKLYVRIHLANSFVANRKMLRPVAG